MQKKAFHTVLLWLFVLCGQAYAQNINIEGYVKDAVTGEVLSFATVFVKGTSYGTITNDEGYYNINIPEGTDSLVASYLGYVELSLKIPSGSKVKLDFELSVSEGALSETIVLGIREPLEDFLFRKIQEYKPENNKASLNNYAFESYNKLEIDIKNFNSQLTERKILKPFSVVNEFIDSTDADGSFLPIFMSETISDFFYKSNPAKKREVVKVTRVSGSKEASLSQFLGTMYMDANIYENSFWLMDKEFISPIAKGGKLFYEYKVTDTLDRDGATHYRMDFVPKNKADNTLVGYFVVSPDNYAIKEIRFSMAPHVNINFVKRIDFMQQFEKINNRWMTTLEDVTVEIKALDKAPGLIARKTTTYKNIRFNLPEIEKAMDQLKLEITVPEDAMVINDKVWDSIRHIPLTSSQQNIYKMVDTIQSLPAYKTYEQILQLIITGSIPAGPISIGPISRFISNNSIEGIRLRLGVSTNSKFSEVVKLGAHVAYGFKDQKWKYGGDIKWLVDTEKRKIIGAEYLNDVDFSGNNSDLLQNDNVFGNLYRRKVPIKMVKNHMAKVFYQQEWQQGYSMTFTAQHRRVDPISIPFSFIAAENANGLPVDDTTKFLLQTEFITRIRIAPGEKYIYPKSLYRQSISGKYPVIQLEYTCGIKDIIGSQYNYHKLVATIDDNVYTRPLGYFSYHIEGGKTFGNIPYWLMNVHPGNETIFLNSGAFSMMNLYEFYSQQYISATFTHHFEGFFLNRIPGIKKLKLREVIHFKAAWGTVNQDNLWSNRLNNSHDLKRIPYMEAGVGLENILKVFRLDAIWRLSYRDLPYAPKFGVRLGFDFSL